jgi:RHS repeat-associated protein
MTLPSGKVLTYGYNIFQPTSISVSGQYILSGATYDPFGPVKGWTWGNGSFASHNFDLRGLTTTHSLGADTRTLDYDPAGQVTAMADTDFDVGYGYDLLGRLTSFTNNNGGSAPGPMFSTTPVMLADIQTAANETGNPAATNPTPWLTTGVRNITATSVQFALERSEVNTGAVTVNETIGYVAIQAGAAGSFSANGGTVSYNAKTTTDTVRGWTNGCYSTNFASAFSGTPTVVASMNRHDSDEGGWVRRCSLSSSAVGFTIDEDVFLDTERAHTTQAVGFAAFSQDFDALFSDGVSSWGMEAARVTLPATTADPSFKSISFRRSYSTVPVVVVLATNETAEPATIRIRNVTTTGFQAVQVEPATNDGVQGAMTLHYLAVEPGTHELPDGTRILAGTRNTNKQQHGSGVTGTEGWQSVTFAGWPGSSGTSGLPNSQAFGYNPNGNRSLLTENGSPYSYTNLANSNRLLSTAGPIPKTYSHDASGNVLSDGVHTYAYDDRGRLTSVDSGTVTYQHNGQGQRVKKQAGATSTLFVYDEAGQLIGEYNSSGVAIRETVWFQGAPVAVLQGTNTYYVHTDHLGTPRVITNGNTVIWRWESDPFGTTAPDEDPDGDLTPFAYNVRFPGQYYDQETGLHYNYFRTYDPSTGRYLESDPIGLDGGLNTFGHVLQNPLRFTDWSGLDVIVDTTDPIAADILMRAYAELTSRKVGIAMCSVLEESPEIYRIKPIDKDIYYCPVGTTDPVCRGDERTVYIDPYNNVLVPTTEGLLPSPKAVSLGHELAHALGILDAGPDSMDTVNKIENPLRRALGLPERTAYYVDEIIFVPGTE